MPTIKYAPVFDEGLIKFLKDCAGVWAAIMLFGATRFFSNGTNLIGVAVCCSLSALLAFVYSLYLNFLSNMRKMQVRQSNVHRFVIGSQVSLISIGLTILGFSILQYYGNSSWKVYVPTVYTSGSHLDKQHSIMFYAAHNIANRLEINPIQLMISLLLQNDTDVSRTIVGYRLLGADQSSGPWTALCPVSMVGKEIVDPTSPLATAQSMGKAFHLTSLHFLDDSLGVPLSGHYSTTLWGAWECKENCSSSFLRLELSTLDGKVDVLPLTLPKHEQDKAALGSSFRVEPTLIDLSGADMAPDSNCQ